METTKQWTQEWYKRTPTEELFENLHEAKKSFGYLTRAALDTASMIWKFRIIRLKEELTQRQETK